MYIVCRITNFDEDHRARTFAWKEDAITFLQTDWEDCYNTWIARDDVFIDEEKTYHEDRYAILSAENGDRVEWYIIPIEEGR